MPQLAYKPPQLQPRAKTTSEETLTAASTLTHYCTPLLAQAHCEPAQQFHGTTLGSLSHGSLLVFKTFDLAFILLQDE